MVETAVQQQLVDLKLIKRPTDFKSEPEKWRDFRESVENYLGCVHASFNDELQSAAASPSALGVDEMTRDVRQRGVILYSFLTSLIASGTAKAIAREIPIKSRKNGYELWRKLVEKYEPVAHPNRGLVLFCKSWKPKL